jgi:hypothetical protein
MTLKGYLAIAGLASDLVGAFLLAVPMLFGVRAALGWILRMRVGLRRTLRLLIHRYESYPLKPGKEILFGWPDASDLKKQAAGQQINITPYYLIPSVLFVAVMAWLLREHIFWMLVASHQAIEQVSGWPRYLLHGITGLTQALFAIVVIVIASYTFWVFSTPLVVVALISLIGVYAFARFFFTIPARVLLWFSRGDREKKMGWLGFALLALGFVLQTYINFI